ncbi:MAG: amidohydrolase family protein [Gammaproteobacteria bacterium]
MRITRASWILALLLPGAFVQAESLWLANARIIDGSGAAPTAARSVEVADGRIRTISKDPAPAGAIDLGGRYLLPGYIDAHTHIEDPASAKRALLSGVTTARVLGDAYLKGLATRDLVRQGDAEGPEMLVSAGHVRPVLGEAFVLSFPQFGRYIDEPLTGDENVATVVAAVIDRGADVIKVGASERAGLASTDPRRPELSQSEIAAAVRVAREKGRFVAAHAHNRGGVEAAVRAGVRSIEHGTYVDEPTLRLMKQQGTWFVPTLAIMSPLGDPRGDDAESIALQTRTYHMMKPLRDAVRRAKGLGVAIATGTDGSYGDGDATARVRIGHEIEELVKAGLTPLEAITAATSSSAELLGIASRTGRVAPGLEADLLVVDRNPLEDSTTLFEPMLVLSDGRIALNRIYD